MDLYISSRDELHLNLDCTKFSTVYFYAITVDSSGDKLASSVTSFIDGNGRALTYVGGTNYPLVHIWKKTFDPCNLNEVSNFIFPVRNQTITLSVTDNGVTVQSRVPPVIVYYELAFLHINSLTGYYHNHNHNCIIIIIIIIIIITITITITTTTTTTTTIIIIPLSSLPLSLSLLLSLSL